MTEALMQSRYRVGGMDCAACAAKIETAARRMPGIEDVSVSLTGGTLAIRHRAGADLASLQKRVAGLGYTIARDSRGASAGSAVGEHLDHGNHEHVAEGLHAHAHATACGPWWKSSRALLTIATGAALALACVADTLLPRVPSVIFVLPMLIGLVPIARRALMASLAGTPFSIEMLMTVAAIGAVAIGASEEAATVVFLFLIGELLEGVAAARARDSIQGLASLVPKTVLVEHEGETEDVPAERLAIGSIIRVRPGDRIGADGEIVDGESAIDEAPVTGESMPARKGKGAAVFAGTINMNGVLRIKVTAAAADNTIARIVRLVEQAQESKAPTQRFIDRFSRSYTPAVVLAAAAVGVLPPLLWGGLWGAWIYKGLAILLIGCPCALVISTPAAIAAGLSAGARRGLLMKGGAVLETLRRVTVVALDKTGTLTEGKPKVTDIIAFNRSGRQILSMAAALASGSNHPLALAILERAKADRVPIPPVASAKEIAGKGVTGCLGGESLFLASESAAEEHLVLSPDQRARLAALNDEGKTVSVLLVGKDDSYDDVAGAMAMRDEPRADAREGLEALAEAGIRTLMLTGDHRRTGEAIGNELGVEAKAELLPQDKQQVVRDLQANGEVVAKVGDGINDAPALAAADVGIAMGGGTDVALETADAAVLHGRVSDVARMVALSKRTMSNIHENIAIALGLKAVFLVTTIIGLTGLWPAILADTGATVLVTANALRLLRTNTSPSISAHSG
jgi:Cd2+/Zn2+-exporting ATPase